MNIQGDSLTKGYDFSGSKQNLEDSKRINKIIDTHDKIIEKFNDVVHKKFSTNNLQTLELDLISNAKEAKCMLDKIEHSKFTKSEHLDSENQKAIDKLKNKLKLITSLDKAAAEMVEIDIQLEKLNAKSMNCIAFIRENPALKGEDAGASRKKIKEILKETDDLAGLIVTKLKKLGEIKEFRESTEMKLCCGRLNFIQELEQEMVSQLVFLKHRKHEEYSESISNAFDSDIALSQKFTAGDEKTVKNYLKLGREGEAVIRGTEGNRPTTENANFQESFEYVLNNFHKARVEVVDKQVKINNLETTIKVIKFHVNSKVLEFTPDSFKNVDFTKIHLTDAQLLKYQTLCENGDFKFNPELTRGVFPTQAHFQAKEKEYDMEDDGRKLSYAEKLAINIYTRDSGLKSEGIRINAFQLINNFMRGNIALAAEEGGLTEAEAAKEALLHTIVCATALAKLPDQPGLSLWRGEGAGYVEFVLESCKKAADEGQEYIASDCFLSTAYGLPSASFFKPNSPVGVLLSGVNGKKIIAWSQFLDKEREVIFLPTALRIKGYKTVRINGKERTFLLIKSENVDLTKPRELDKTKPAALQVQYIRQRVKEEDAKIEKMRKEKVAEAEAEAEARREGERHWFGLPG
jgi:hypothetical protein